MQTKIVYDLGSLADWVSGIGSLAAVFVAIIGFFLIERQRRADDRGRERGTAYELIAVIRDIGCHIRAIEVHFETQRNDITITHNDQLIENYRALNPLIGLSDEGSYRAPVGSTELLVKAGGVALWNDIMLLVNRNQALTTLMKEYRLIWDTMLLKMPAPEGFTGTIGHIAAGSEQLAIVRADLVRVDTVVAALDAQVRDTSILLNRVSTAIGPLMKDYFKEPFLHLAGPVGPDVQSAQGNDPQVEQ